MYEQIYNLTSMFFKCLKGNLMYEFLISKFNGKRGSKRQLSLGDKCEILEPAHVREKLKQKIKNLAEIYSDS